MFDDDDDTQLVLLLVFDVQTILIVENKPMTRIIKPTTIIPHATASTDGPNASAKNAHRIVKPMINQMKPAMVVKNPQ